jgi:hypothetical protein
MIPAQSLPASIVILDPIDEDHAIIFQCQVKARRPFAKSKEIRDGSHARQRNARRNLDRMIGIDAIKSFGHSVYVRWSEGKHAAGILFQAKTWGRQIAAAP